MARHESALMVMAGVAIGAGYGVSQMSVDIRLDLRQPARVVFASSRPLPRPTAVAHTARPVQTSGRDLHSVEFPADGECECTPFLPESWTSRTGDPIMVKSVAVE